MAHKQYEAMRAFFYEKQPAAEVAERFGYTVSAVYGLARNFRRHLKDHPDIDFFFTVKPTGRPVQSPPEQSALDEDILALRKQNYSTPEITSMLQAKGHKANYNYVYDLLMREGFARLPRRTKTERQELKVVRLEAPKAQAWDGAEEYFDTQHAGLLCFLPILRHYGIDELIRSSDYPQTREISRLSAILSFLALKLSNVRRYSADDLWCMDRGSGLFAGLNVLPKAAWFSSYSHRVTRQMNLDFLRRLHRRWLGHGLLGDTANLDFTAIPYWGDEDGHLENNWSGKRSKALASMLAVLAHDPDTGIIDYGHTDVQRQSEAQVVLEYLDFYRADDPDGKALKYLVFDSRFTNYENLAQLDERNVKFITIRRRGKNMIRQIEQMPASDWKTLRVEAAGNRKRTLKAADQTIFLPGYGKDIRQVVITGHGKIKPALIISNDFAIPLEQIVRKYCRRWLIEKSISEQIDFFHLNRLSSSMVIKVDFDLVMTILAHNLYRLLALELGRYQHLADQSVFDRFIYNAGTISISMNDIRIFLKKKRDLPQILTAMSEYQFDYPWLHDKRLAFEGASFT
ncbi:MAG: transposase [Lewinellaceae bacterium]|nr:transposase [Lewinellaceae bacterium]MCB9296231.1 transposase [Lewinellaceae bacterium]